MQVLIISQRSLALIVLFAIVGYHSSDLNSRFKSAKKFLLGVGKGKDARAYIEAAEKRLKSSFFSPSLLGIKTSFEEGLKIIVRLGQISDSPTCDLDEFIFLNPLKRYTDGHKYIPEEEIKNLSPLDLIANQVSVERANKCRDKHLENFVSIYSKLNEGTKTLAEFYRERLTKKEHQETKDYIAWLIDYTFILNTESLKVISDHVKVHSANDPDKCKHGKMFHKYVFKPCQDYEANLGIPVLNQVRFDGRMFPGKEGYSFKEEFVPLYQAMASNTSCGYLIFMSQEIEKSVVNLLKGYTELECE